MKFKDVSPKNLSEWLSRNNVRLIDVREADEHARATIPNAENRPLSRFTVPDAFDGPTVVYCRSGRRSAEAAGRMVDAGLTEVFNLEGGIQAWQKADLPIAQTKGAPIAMMRQVQIVAGSLMLIGTTLGAFVSPWFLLLSGFVGAGLLFAGVTDTCGMALLLGKMPWNRQSSANSSGLATSGTL